jgi:flavin-dependent dehydrogenase
LISTVINSRPVAVPAIYAPASVRTTLTEQGTQFPYAFHFDATLLAKYLTKYGTDRGVKHVLDVVVDERGWISHVVTKEHGEIHGDLFVDCTGFRGMLLNKAMGEPFVSYQDTLPNDSAVALRVPADMEEQGIRPCTTATAQDAGWIWTIPLFGRVGTGYVHASDYCTPDEAERTLRDFVGPEAEDLEANHIIRRRARPSRPSLALCSAPDFDLEPRRSTGLPRPDLRATLKVTTLRSSVESMRTVNVGLSVHGPERSQYG